MNLSRLLAMTSTILFAAVLTVGCAQEQGPAERTGAEIDRAVEDAREAGQEALEAVEETAEDAVDAAEEAAEDAQRAVEDATN